MKIKYPKNEIVWETKCDNKGRPKYIITSKPVRDYYFLYEVMDDGSVDRKGKAKTPISFYNKIQL